MEEDMANNNGFEIEMVKPEDDSTLKSMINSSGQICTDLLNIAIEDAKTKKEILVSTMDSVISLMREVEFREKAAEQSQEEAQQCSLGILEKVNQLKQTRQHAKESNDMLARKVYAQKAALAAEMKVLQLRVLGVLNKEDRSFGVLDEMRRVLESSLSSALIKKEIADKEKLEKESSAREALAYEESQMEKVVEESNRLKQETIGNSKLHEFLIVRGHVVDALQREISAICHDVNLPKELLDQGNILSGLWPSCQTSCQPQPEKIESEKTPMEKFDSTSDKSNLDLEKHEGNTNGIFEADIKEPPWVADIIEEGPAMSSEGVNQLSYSRATRATDGISLKKSRVKILRKRKSNDLEKEIQQEGIRNGEEYVIGL